MNRLKPREYSDLLHEKISTNINSCTSFNIRLKIYYSLYEKVFDLMDEIDFLMEQETNE